MVANAKTGRCSMWAVAVFVTLGWTLPAYAQQSTPPDILKEIFGGEAQALQLEAEEEDKALTLEEIVNPVVTSASRSAESSLTAPAWVITLSGTELRERGYVELSQILDDLPGIDVVRPWGEAWFRSYWRAKRSVWGDHFLFMVDGIEWHDASYNNARMMIPISHIERVEVVYGPGSLMFGANAIMGTINVITKLDTETYGSSLSSSHAVRAPQSMLENAARFRYLSDLSYLFKSKDFRVRLTTRFEHGYVDEGVADRYEWFDEQYYSSDVWGDALIEQFPRLSGRFRSRFQDSSFDLRFATDKVEVGMMRFAHTRGTGMQFTGDRMQNKPMWTDVFSGAHLRYQASGPNLHSVFTARFKRSEWPAGNSLLSRSVDGTPDGLEEPTITYFTAENETIEIDEKLTYSIPNLFRDASLRIVGGLTYRLSSLAEDFSRTSIPVARIDNPVGALTTMRVGQTKRNSLGGYLLAKYNLNEDQFFDVGLRQTYYNHLDDPMLSYRLAYVTRFAKSWTLKLMVGHSYSLPNQRQLSFNVATISANPDLNAETSRTVELGLNYSSDILNVQLNPYWVTDRNAIKIVDDDGDGTYRYADRFEQNILGIDLALVAQITGFGAGPIKAWSYITWHPWMLEKDKDSADSCSESPLSYAVIPFVTDLTENRECYIGDIAHLKIKAGVTAEPISKVLVTALARAVSERRTVSTNPKTTIDPYLEVDVTLMLKDFLFHDVHLTATVANVFDTYFTHPGIARADGGIPDLTVDPDAIQASTSKYSSRLPQPGRSFQVMLVSEFE
ncbi:MAG: TonB-dependent receptor [Myxococcota bacterium]|nr:TonB-dependent receptor [Myxococcota bacterium]